MSSNKQILFVRKTRRYEHSKEASSETVSIQHKSEMECKQYDDPILVPEDSKPLIQILKEDDEISNYDLRKKIIIDRKEIHFVNGMLIYSCLKSLVGGLLRQTYPARSPDRTFV